MSEVDLNEFFIGEKEIDFPLLNEAIAKFREFNIFEYTIKMIMF